MELKDNFGCVGIIIDAKEEAIEFYKHFGFIEMKIIEKYLTVPMYLSIKVFQKN